MPPILKISDQNDCVDTKLFPYAHWKYEKFNPPQSRVFEFYDKNVNGLIASMTSSGKTTMAEMFLAHEVRVHKKKGMYLVPMRALAQEKIDDWTDKNHHFADLKISICTGDYRLTKERTQELRNADIIIMSTEMLNHRCRNFKSEHNDYLLDIGVCIVDESHLLTVPGRGDHLEVGLMKLTSINPEVKVFLLSATMPNVEEIAEWVSYSLTKRETFCLRSNYRPCMLNIHYESYYDLYQRYDDKEAEKIAKAIDIVDYYENDKFLIFAHTKRTGELMKEALRANGIKAEFHNASLEKKQRIELENNFRKEKEPRVIVATPTLAWGCYIKGTPVLMADGIIKPIETIQVGDKVLSKSSMGFVSKNVLRVGPKQVLESLEFILATGEKVVVSPEHKFYGTIDRKNPDYFEAEEFIVGDYLAVPGPLNVCNVEADDYGYLTGYVMGDGSKTAVGLFANGECKNVLDISFGSDEIDHADYVNELMRKLFDFSMNGPRCDINGVFHLTSKRREIVSKFNQPLPGRNKANLSLMNLPRNDAPYIRGVLQGLFDTDGGFAWHGNGYVSLEFTTISKKLASDVQQYLLFFGVRSSTGRKKMKDTIIKGRLQVARRKWIYRVRIYGCQVANFLKNIGFRNQNKQKYGQYVMENGIKGQEKNIIPVRGLLHDHAKANGVTAKEIAKAVNIDLWNILNKQDLKLETCLKIIKLFPNQSSLTDLLQSNIRFSKIKSIKYLPGQEMHDIEVEDLHNYVGGGVISHNCNLPARRVILLGVHRGLEEVETYNITQMIGRSGRVGLDPQGDAYILLPESKMDFYKNKLKTPQRIDSQLLSKVGDHHKVLAFHLVSEIHHGDIRTNDDIHAWYKRSLAFFQNKELDSIVVDKTMELLRACGAVKQEGDAWSVLTVGMVASMFYFSPFDASDLKKNFHHLFDKNNQDNDFWLSMALGDLDSHRLNIVSKVEKEEMSMYATKIRQMMPGRYNDAFGERALKAGFCYYQLLNGNNSSALAATQRNLQFDYNRLSQVLIALDSMGCKWGRIAWFKNIEQRIANGVPMYLVDLCRVSNIGKVRGKRLYEAGIKTAEDFANMNPEQAKKLLGNVKIEVIKEMLAEASSLAMTSSGIL
jgi:replicative superfamily II helicase